MVRALRAVGRISSLVLSCAAVGAGVGFFLGEMTTRKWDRTAQISFAEGSACFGALVAVIVGPIVYIALRPRISFGEFSAIVAGTLLIGALAALLGGEFFVPIAAVLGTAGAALTVHALRKDV